MIHQVLIETKELSPSPAWRGGQGVRLKHYPPLWDHKYSHLICIINLPGLSVVFLVIYILYVENILKINQPLHGGSFWTLAEPDLKVSTKIIIVLFTVGVICVINRFAIFQWFFIIVPVMVYKVRTKEQKMFYGAKPETFEKAKDLDNVIKKIVKYLVSP